MCPDSGADANGKQNGKRKYHRNLNDRLQFLKSDGLVMAL